jgi:hypothetical protein
LVLVLVLVLGRAIQMLQACHDQTDHGCHHGE